MNSWVKPVLYLLIFLYCALASDLGSTAYYNYKVVEVSGIQLFHNEDEFFTTLDLPLDQDLEILHEDPFKGALQVLVNPTLQAEFRKKVTDHELTYDVLIENVGELIDSSNNLRSEAQALDGEVTFDRYMTFQEIENFLRRNGKRISSKVRVTTIGQSYEGENITMVTISDSISKNKRKSKPIIFVEAGAHPREWISISSALYLVDRLSKYTRLTREVEWRIVPVLNPDGYKYTWTNSRLWRKNRRQEENTYCRGVDLNRNFDSYWNQIGSSKRRCSSVYAGKYAFSEPETQALRNAVLDVKHRIKAYISVHSYGQLLMYPPGGSFHSLSTKSSTMLDHIAKKMSDAILRSTKTAYKIGSPKALLYSASGISMDWAMLTAKIPLAFTIEMRDKGKNGFLLPNSEIQSAVSDIWNALNVLHGIVTNQKSNSYKYELNRFPLLRTSSITNETAQENDKNIKDIEHDLNSTIDPIIDEDPKVATYSNNIESQTEESIFLQEVITDFEKNDHFVEDTLIYPEEALQFDFNNSEFIELSGNYQTDKLFSIDNITEEFGNSVSDSVSNLSHSMVDAESSITVLPLIPEFPEESIPVFIENSSSTVDSQENFYLDELTH